MGSIAEPTMLDSSAQISERPPSPSALSNLISTHPQSSSTTSLPLEILHNLRHQHRWTDLKLYSPNDISKSVSVNELGNKSGGISPTTSTSSTPTTTPPSNPLLLPSPISSSSTSPLISSSPAPPVPFLSGTPPTPLYTHPNLQLLLLKQSPNNQDRDQARKPEREFVLPTSLGRKWTLRELCAVFDYLPVRDAVRVRVRKGVHSTGKKGGAEKEKEKGGREGGDEGQESGNGNGNENGNENGNGDGDGDGEEWISHQDAKRILWAMKSQDGFGGDGTVVYYVLQEGEVKPRQN